MPSGQRNNIKRVDELQPGEFVMFGSYWMMVEAVEPGEMSKYVGKQLAIVRGWIQPWVRRGGLMISLSYTFTAAPICRIAIGGVRRCFRHGKREVGEKDG